MRIECPKCHKKYEVEEMYIPIGGGPVRCPNCKNIFGIYVEPMDIPMTEIIEEEGEAIADAKGPFAKPEFGETSFSPDYAPEIQKEEPMPSESIGDALGDLGSFSSSVPDTEPPFSQTQQNLSSFGDIPFESSVPEAPAVEAEPPVQEPMQSMDDFGVPPAFAQPKPIEPAMPNFGASPFAQPQTKPAPAPDFGVPPAFAQTKPIEPAMPDLGASPFAQPQTKPAPAPDFGVPPAFAQPKPIEPAMPDFGASPFAQPQTKPAPAPDFGVPPAFAQPKPIEHAMPDLGASPFAQPEIKPQPAPAQPQSVPAGGIRAGGPMFDVLLAGFTLPPNFNSLPENMQKVHKDAVKLARQLAKDILLYHKDEVEKGMANGNIKESMKDEIEKSYKFYTQRIQPEIISGSNYFNEALNKIVAKGQKLF